MSTAAAAAGSAPSPLSTAPASPLSPPVRTNAALDAGDVAKRMLSFDLNAGTPAVLGPAREGELCSWQAAAGGTWGPLCGGEPP